MNKKLPTRSLEQRRVEAVKLRAAGIPVMQVVAQTGMCWSAVNAAVKLYAIGGSEALTPRARGRKPGTKGKLTDDQRRQIRSLMRLRRPWYYGLGSTLWTRELAMQLIKNTFGVTMTDRALGNYLMAWGIEIGSRSEQPRERCSPLVRRWLDVNYAALVSHAREVSAAIYWMNKPRQLPTTLWAPEKAVEGVGGAAMSVEMGDASDEYDGDGSCDDDLGEFGAVSGESSHASRPAHTKTYRLASAINNQGKLCWAVINSTFNSKQRLRFVNALVKDERKQNLVIINLEGGPRADAEVEVWKPDADATVWVVP